MLNIICEDYSGSPKSKSLFPFFDLDWAWTLDLDLASGLSIGVPSQDGHQREEHRVDHVQNLNSGLVPIDPGLVPINVWGCPCRMQVSLNILIVVEAQVGPGQA